MVVDGSHRVQYPSPALLRPGPPRSARPPAEVVRREYQMYLDYREPASKQDRGRLPSITSPDAWEKRMAEGVAFLARMKAEAARG